MSGSSCIYDYVRRIALVPLVLNAWIMVVPQAHANNLVAQNSIGDFFKSILSPVNKLFENADEVRLTAFPPLSQKSPQSYRSPSFMTLEDVVSGGGKTTSVENLACLATVYAMIGRGTGSEGAVVEDYYEDPRKYDGNGPGARRPPYVRDEIALDLAVIKKSIDAGQPVILHGKGGPLKDHFILVTGYRKNATGIIALLANDPWPAANTNKNDGSQDSSSSNDTTGTDQAASVDGARVQIDVTSQPIRHPTITALEFSAMRLVNLSNQKFFVSRIDEGPCKVISDQFEGSYTGACNDGYANGRGKVERREALFEGEFRNGRATGEGKVTVFDKYEYVGELLDGKTNGKGTLVLSSGARYEGDFQSGKFSGQGTFTDADGTKYVGGFLNNLMHGDGTITSSDGGSKSVKHANGVLVSPAGTSSAASREKSGVSSILTAVDSGRQRADTGSRRGDSQGTSENIADAFYRDSASAIRFFSEERQISLKVDKVSSQKGVIYLSETQAPASLMRQSAQQARKPFSWDNFHSTAVMGNNVYAQIFQIVCAVSAENFSKMANVRTGVTINITAKLNSFNDKQVLFDCK